MKKTILTLTFFLAAFPAHADNVQKNQTYVISDFSGGLSTKASPFNLPPKYATIAENIRFDTKLWAFSRRTNLNTYGSADATEPITGLFRHYMKSGDKVLLAFHGDEMEKGSDSAGTFTNILNLTSGDHKWQCVTWHDIAICSDGYNQPVKYDGSSTSATYIGSLLSTVTGAGSGPDTGTHSYKVACYSTTYTVLLNTASNTITGNGNDAALTMIPVCPDTTLNGEATTGRKVYRTEAGGSTYKLLSNGTIANNTATTLTDSDADAALGATMPAGDATWQPPTGKFLLVQNNRLFFANDPTNSPSRVWYSEDGLHDIFINTSYLDVRQNDGDSITFMKGVLGLLTIGKNNTIQKIYIDGADPDEDWSISDPLSYVGCQAPYSAVNSPLGIIYLAKDGIYRFNGYNSELLSDSVTPEIEDISPTNSENTWGIYHENMYHLAYTSEASGEATNNRVLVLDILSKAYSIDLLNINAFATFNSGNDWGVLYGGSSTNGSVYAYSNEVNEIVHKRHSDFAGLWDDMRYIPTDAGGDSESPVLEISRTETIDQLSGTINSLVGDIDRQDNEGHYVSQSLAVGANSFDKIYWNDSIPAAGGNVTFQIRTSPTGEDNLLLNDDFEWWDNWDDVGATEEPNDWHYAQDGTGGSADQSTTETKRGTYSCKITKSNSAQSYVYITIPNASNYQGKTLAFSGWVKSANTVASKVRFQLTDGFGTTTTNYANGGGWEELQGTLAVNAAATTITFKAVVETGADAVAYFDRVMVVQASDAVNDWTAWSTAVSNSSGSDISSVTANRYVEYHIDMTTSNIDYTPNVIRRSGYNVRLTYNKEGTPASTDIPIHYASAWLDLGSPSRTKVIRGIETYHEGQGDDIVVTISNFDNTESDTWTIDTAANPTYYSEKTTGGAISGSLFKVDITSTGTEPLNFSKLIIHYDTEEFV